MRQQHIWTCSGCGREFAGSAIMPPPDWQWRGSRLLCEDCQRSNDPQPAANDPAPRRDGAVEVAA